MTSHSDPPSSISAEIKRLRGDNNGCSGVKVTASTLQKFLSQGIISATSANNVSGTTTPPTAAAAAASDAKPAATTLSDDFQVENLWIDTYSCLKWDDKDRNALLEFIRHHSQAIQRIEIFLSNGTVKQSPAPTRSFLFALSIIHDAAAAAAAAAPTTSPKIKLTLDLYSLNFLDAAHFLSYVGANNARISELEVTNLFQQKPNQVHVLEFLQAIRSLKQKQQQAPNSLQTIQLFDRDKPLVIQNMDVTASKLLTQAVAFFLDSGQPPLQQLRLHIKKLNTTSGGLRALATFLQKEDCPIRTLYLDIDGKIPKGSDSDLFHSILQNKKLLCNPNHSNTTTADFYVLPITTVFLRAGIDGCQLVVSPGILTQKSKYFRVLFSGRFARTDNYIVKLPDIDGIALQALVTYLRYGKERRLDIPDCTFCDHRRRFQAMTMLAHLAYYLLLEPPGLLAKVYKLLSDTLRRFPDAAFVALKVFRKYNQCNLHLPPLQDNCSACYCKSIPKVFELLVLKHIRYAEVQLLDGFVKEEEESTILSRQIKGILDEASTTSPPIPITFVGQDSKRVKLRYSKGLKTFLERVEEYTQEGYLDPQTDLITPPCQMGLITSAQLGALAASGGNTTKTKGDTAAVAAAAAAAAATAVMWTRKQVLLLVLFVILSCWILGGGVESFYIHKQ